MPFGIWMPRNSNSQALAGDIIDLQDKTDAEKEQLIVALGQPFFSLITMPGHVALYVGAYEEQAYIYHQVWGLFLTSDDGLQRSKIGRTVLIALKSEESYKDIDRTLLTKTTGLLLLADRLAKPTNPLPLHNSKAR